MELSQLSKRDKFILSRWAYSIGEELIPNHEYNLLREYMETVNKDDEYVNRSWSSDPCPVELLRKVGREDLINAVILSDKTESIPTVNDVYDFHGLFVNLREPGTLSMKHDGWNIQANYYNGELVTVHTRGRYSDSVDASALKERFPKTIPVKERCKVVCELTVSKQNFPICKSLFNNVNCRSAVSSVLARPEYHYLLDYHAFDIHGVEFNRVKKFQLLREWGFETPLYVFTSCYDDIVRGLQELSEQNVMYASPTDGAVYDGSMTRAIRLMAWEEPIYKSFVTGYTEKYNKYRISPTLDIYPVVREGTTQSHLTITNWARIIEYNLQPGAPVAFRCASGAIADFDEESTVLLHKQYEGRWREFAEHVKLGEEYRGW